MTEKAEPNQTYLLNSASAGCSLFLSKESEDIPILNLVGEVDLGSAPRIYALMWQTSERGEHSLVVNLEKLDFMDSSGLQILLRLKEKLKAKRRDIYLVAPQPQIRKLFKLTGFDRLFSMTDNNSQAEYLARGRQRPTEKKALS